MKTCLGTKGTGVHRTGWISGGFSSLVALTMLLAGPVAGAAVLVVAPHPDDDVITSAGVVQRAAGWEEVIVVYMTNGDITGTSLGLTRQAEAVNAQVQNLGMNEDSLIFLGYPDGSLNEIFQNYRSSTDRFVTPFGQGQTYGNRGLGRRDYHSYRFGSPASYNLANVVLDLETILRTYRPTQVFTTAEFDRHSDHATTYQMLRLALQAVRATDSSYAPVVNKTVVWSSDWARWPGSTSPATRHTEPPGLPSGIRWSDRQSLDVPSPMQDPNLVANPKYQAIQAHRSQAGAQSFIGRWARKDEFFWSENPFGSNQPPIVDAGDDVYAAPGRSVNLNGSGSRDPEGAGLTYSWTIRSGSQATLRNSNTATPVLDISPQASPESVWTITLVVSDGQLSSPADSVTVHARPPARNMAFDATVLTSSQSSGQEGALAVDGLVDGYPMDYTREWATLGQRAGAWISLAWPEAVVVSAIELFDRPNTSDQVTAGSISFSDGTTLPVGSLVNDGSRGTRLEFSSRAITGLTFTATAVSSSTLNAGLSEIRVLSSVADQDSDPPSVPGAFTVAGTTSSSITLQWSASVDPGGSGVAGYRLYREPGPSPSLLISGTSFTDAGLPASTTYAYRVTAVDNAGNESAAAGPVMASTTAGAPANDTNLALGAQASASSQNVATGQVAAKAIDGYIDGWPGNYSREWATVGGRSGSWLTLTWPAPVLVNRVVLFDRPNSSDQVTAGTISFSDGSSVAVGALPNGGAAAAVSFTGRTVQSLTFRITGVSASTANVGLAEIQVYGSGAPPPDVTPPSQPTGLVVTASTATSLSLGWQPATDAGGSGLAGYYVFRNGSSSPVANVTTTAFTDTGLAPDTAYSYQVAAYDAAGNRSAASAPVTGRTSATAPPAPANIAPLATVAASSESAATDQLARKATDGSADGWPGDYRREWATLGQGQGAWIRLTWPRAYRVSRIVLNDRPNSADWIRAAEILFDDGSVVPVGALLNSGADTEVTFAERSTTSIRINVTAVGSSTLNVGLAELGVYGY